MVQTRAVVWIIMTLILCTLIYATLNGDLVEEVRTISALPWGIATLVDIYVGFVLFSCWIVSREESLVRSGLWVFLLFIGGNLIACIYVLIAIYKSKGDVQQFWMGLGDASSERKANA